MLNMTKLFLLMVCLGCVDAHDDKVSSRFIYGEYCNTSPYVLTIIDKKHNMEYVVGRSGHGYVLLDRHKIDAEKDLTGN
jgi:hypothetical protein